MLPVLRAADARTADAAAVEAGTPVAALMEHAGWAVAQVARNLLRGAYGRRVVVVCGTGNNAGDGLVVARTLARWGAFVDVVGVAGDRFSGAAADARTLWRGPVLAPVALEEALSRADLAIDAIFGVGLSRDVEGDAAKAIAALNASPVPVVAVDVPSGIEADTGAVRGVAVDAARTVTFGGVKPGLLFAPGREHAGAIDVADIGIPDLDTEVRALAANDVAVLWPTRSAGAHKRDAGTLLVVAGSVAMPGAAILTCRAAVRSGVGLITLAAPREVLPAIVAAVPELTTIPLDADAFATEHLAEVILHAEGRVDALAIGPGLGRHPDTLAATAALLDGLPVPAVVDADALLALGGVLREAPTIVTPHAGEWAAILDEDAAVAAADRLAAAERLVDTLRQRIPAIVGVLKGSGTVVRAMDRSFLDVHGGAELAQGGTGDALTGILGAVVAAQARKQALDQLGARVAAGVWVHSRAARIAVSAHGGSEPAGTTQLIEAIPAAIASAFDQWDHEGVRGDE